MQHYKKWIRALATGVIAVIASGCAQLPGSAAPPLTAEQKAALQEFNHTGLSARNPDLSVRILKSVLPGDPEYFPKVSSWAEYVFEIQTYGTPIKFNSAGIVSKEGAPVSAAFSSDELTEAPKFARQYAERTGLGAAVTYGSTMLGYSANIPFIGPIMQMGMGAIEPLKADAKAEYDKQFSKKMRTDVTHLEPDGKLIMSGFFPLVSGARSIVVEYEKGTGFHQSGRIEIPLKSNSIRTGDSIASESSTLDARGAQAILNALDYSTDTPDGIIGKRSIDALKRFQQSEGLPVSGALDEPTKAALLARRP